MEKTASQWFAMRVIEGATKTVAVERCLMVFRAERDAPYHSLTLRWHHRYFSWISRVDRHLGKKSKFCGWDLRGNRPLVMQGGVGGVRGCRAAVAAQAPAKPRGLPEPRCNLDFLEKSTSRFAKSPAHLDAVQRTNQSEKQACPAVAATSEYSMQWAVPRACTWDAGGVLIWTIPGRFSVRLRTTHTQKRGDNIKSRRCVPEACSTAVFAEFHCWKGRRHARCSAARRRSSGLVSAL
jgi:hypothetical protein